MIEKIEKHLSIGINLAAVLFVAACLFHYFSLRPLWLDEVFIYKNLQNYSGIELFRTLDHTQAFPRVYLGLIQALSHAFNGHVLALRFLPLSAMIGAFFIWVRLIRKEFSSNIYVFLFVLSFACSYRMTYYAAELKPYSMDVLVVVLTVWMVKVQRSLINRNFERKDFWLAALQPCMLLFSYAAIFVFWIPYWNYVGLVKNQKRMWPLVVCNGLSCVGVFALFYFLDLRYSLSVKGLHNYWESYFLCTDSPACFFDTFGDGLKKLVTYWQGSSKAYIRGAVIFIPFFLYSLFRLGWKKWAERRGMIMSLETVGLILLGELFVLGCLHKYPFTGERITLFFAPFVYWGILKGMEAMKNISFLNKIFVSYYLLYSCVCLVNMWVIHGKLY